MKLEKFEKWCKFASEGITRFDVLVLWGSFLLGAVFHDLQLESAEAVCGGIMIGLISWYLCTFVCLVVLACIKKHRSKKTNIEKLIEEEERKD